MKFAFLMPRSSGSRVLFLKVHTLNEKEIDAHPSLVKIRAMCGQIDDLYERWRSSEATTAGDYQLYTEKRVEVERELGKLRVRIVERKPTFLDLILRAFDTIAQFVRER